MARKKTVEVNVMEVREEIAKKEQEIRNMEATLSNSDYKVIKCMEHQMLEKEMPYDVNELNEQRQAIRDQINTLEDEIAGLQTQVNEATAE